MQISVSPTSFSDWQQLVSLLRESFSYMESRIDPPSSLVNMSLEKLKAKAENETLIVVQEGQNILGCAFAAVRDDCVYVGKVAVAQSARNTGIARAMLAAAEDLARKHGRLFLELQTRVEPTENHATFVALGFNKVAADAVRLEVSNANSMPDSDAVLARLQQLAKVSGAYRADVVVLKS